MLVNANTRWPGLLVGPARRWPGLVNPRRGASLAALYGVGMGQIPLHLAPEAAVLTAGSIESIPNRAGAGAAFDAAKAGTETLTMEGALVRVPAGVAYLNLASAANLVGCRLFIVTGFSDGLVGNINFAGRSSGAGAGERTNLRWDTGNTRLQLQRWDGAAFGSALLDSDLTLGTALRLVEVEVAAGLARLWINGALQSSVSLAWPDFYVGRVFAGHSAPFFSGLAGDVLSVVTDGAPARDAVMLTVRSALAAKHGIALA